MKRIHLAQHATWSRLGAALIGRIRGPGGSDQFMGQVFDYAVDSLSAGQ